MSPSLVSFARVCAARRGGRAVFPAHPRALPASIRPAPCWCPTTAAPKSCSGAFRYAARVGNSDIVAVSPVQVFANDRRFARTRYTGRAMAGSGPSARACSSLNTMCGAR